MSSIFTSPQEEAAMLNHTNELLSALDAFFLRIIKMDLNTGNAWLLQSANSLQQMIQPLDWADYFSFFEERLLPQEVQKLKAFLSLPHLKELQSSGIKQHTLELSRYHEAMDGFQVIASFPADTAGMPVYILTRYSDTNPLLQHIIDLYVYNTCDYFIYLDAKNNSYTMFSGNQNGTPLPPAVCSDYSAELVKYADAYVALEDRDMVIQEMQLDRVISVLEGHTVHTFTCGVIENERYTRKRLEYRYYDREKQMILLTRTDITDVYNEQLRQTKKLNDALQRALTDPLTGLLNYQGIQEYVTQALEDLSGISALLFLDLDDFKEVNDSYGHVEGDVVLARVAETLRTCIRSTDFASRIGGDEFVIFLRGLQNTEEAAACARRICDRTSQIQFGSNGKNLSCSIGVAVSPQDGTTYDALVRAADKKVYRSKADGKNQFTL